MALTCFCVRLDVENICCDDTGCVQPLTMNLSLIHDGTPINPDNNKLLNTVIEPTLSNDGECFVASCSLPANLGDATDRIVGVSTSAYQVSVTDGNGNVIFPSTTFQLDANIDYSGILVNGCIPLSALVGSADVPVAASLFCDQVTSCMAATIDTINGRITAVETVIAGLVDLNTTNASLTVGTPSATDLSAIRLTLEDSDGNTVVGDIPCATLLAVLQTCEPDDQVWTITQSADGTTTTFLSPDGTLTFTIGPETDAVFTQNVDGSFTLIDDDGTVVNIPARNDTTAMLVNNGDGSSTVTINGVVARLCQTCTVALGAGDTAGVDLLLTDGTTLAAGTPVPDGQVIIAQLTADGSTVVSQAATRNNANTDNTSALLVEGETAPIDLLLVNGSTLPAGDPVPAGEIIHYVTDLSGGLVSQQAFAAAGADTWFVGAVLHAGDVAVVDLILPDGSTLAAGDPVPASTIIHYTLSSTGVLINQNSFTLPTGGTGSSTTSVFLHAGDTSTVDLILPNGSTLVAGTAVPASTIIHYVLADDGVTLISQNSLELSTTAFDLCAALAALAVGACADADELVTAGCERVATDAIIPGHAFAQTACPGETLDPVSAGGGGANFTLSMTELAGEQFGNQVVIGTPIPAGTFPYTAAVPAAHDENNLLFLHIGYGGLVGGGLTMENPSVVGTVGGGAATFIDGERFDASAAGGMALYAFDTSSAVAGDTVVVDFTNRPENQSGVVMLVWSEVARSDGAPLTLADLNLGGIIEVGVPAAGITAPGQTATTSAFNANPSGCDAIFFGVARHALGANDDGAQPLAPGAWSSIGSASETYEYVSIDNDSCQMGVTGGIIPAAAGAGNTATFTGNSNISFIAAGDIATWYALPVSVCDAAAAAATVDGAVCSTTVTNTNCRQSGVTRNSYRASVELNVGPGDNATVVPVLDGVELVDQAMGFDNTNGTDTATITFPLSFSILDLTTLAPGASRTDSLLLRVSSDIDDAATNALISPSTLDTEVIHV